MRAALSRLDEAFAGPIPREFSGGPTWTEVDQLLELERSAARREREWDRFLVQEDEVELMAARCLEAYQLLGGTVLTLPAWRARVRELISEINGVLA